MKDLQIIVVAPTGRDGQLICRLLARVGIDAVESPDCISACLETENGVGALIIADEAIDAASVTALKDLVSRQPSWSDLPIMVLTRGGQVSFLSEERRRLRGPVGDVVLIERPVRPETLVSMVQSKIRARCRQYEVRDHLRTEKIAAEALRRAEKLAVAGRLAASIAHEINNPLTAVTNLHYLMRTATSLEEAQRYLAIADQELARVVEITKQTLRFHRGNTQPSAVRVAEILDSVLKLYSLRLAAKNIVVDRKFDRSAVISGFGGELRQLASNLIGNSVDAMHAGGKLRLRVSCSSERHNGLRRGIRVVVADTGIGIPASIQHKIFEPFVSSKGDTGTGLGLWISSEIVRKHGGTLRFRSRPRAGTVFSIFLPDQAPAASVAA
jgi:signal transduction histidine kinase